MGNTMAGVAPFEVFRTADGWCAIAAPLQHEWNILAETMGRTEMLADERLGDLNGRAVHRDEIDTVVTAWASVRTTDEIIELLGGKIPVAPVRNASDWMADPGVAARGMIVGVEHAHHQPVPQLGCPIKFASTPTGVHRRAPLLDEHGAEIRAELAERRNRQPTGSTTDR
jgi:crotonobetainyl-CoA:carnitine CoA-transferase CaiB-like acyl-CoA transferase